MVNRIILIGNLGADPEVRTLENGAMVAKLRLATNENYRDKSGEWRQAEWTNQQQAQATQHQKPDQRRGQSRTQVQVEIRGHILESLQQHDPRSAALENVGTHHVDKTPVLEVLALHIRQQPDRMTGASDTVAQFNILDAGPVEFRAETAQLQEQITTQGAATGPECRGLTGSTLVIPVMKQVAVA